MSLPSFKYKSIQITSQSVQDVFSTFSYFICVALLSERTPSQGETLIFQSITTKKLFFFGYSNILGQDFHWVCMKHLPHMNIKQSKIKCPHWPELGSVCLSIYLGDWVNSTQTIQTNNEGGMVIQSNIWMLLTKEGRKYAEK